MQMHLESFGAQKDNMPTPQIASPENSTAGPSKHKEDSTIVTEGLGVLPSVQAQLQWALRQSMIPLEDQDGGFPGGK